MPFYEYQCQACASHHEELQKMSDAPLKKCPACGKAKLKRLISAPVFRLKGGGWYETDFKTDKDAKRNLAGDEAKSDGPTETKEAAAAPTAPAAPAAEAAPAPKPEPKESSKSAAKAGPKKAVKKAAKPARKAAKRR